MSAETASPRSNCVSSAGGTVSSSVERVSLSAIALARSINVSLEAGRDLLIVRSRSALKMALVSGALFRQFQCGCLSWRGVGSGCVKEQTSPEARASYYSLLVVTRVT